MINRDIQTLCGPKILFAVHNELGSVENGSVSYLNGKGGYLPERLKGLLLDFSTQTIDLENYICTVHSGKIADLPVVYLFFNPNSPEPPNYDLGIFVRSEHVAAWFRQWPELTIEQEG